MSASGLVVPDSIDVIVAWRAWRFNDLLGSLNNQSPIFPGVPQSATCNALRNHECPDPDCTCGIYATASLEQARRQIDSGWGSVLRNSAIGRVYLWGKVVHHEEGWRAQYAYPKSVLAPTKEITARLAKLYQIEEEMSCTWDALSKLAESNPWESLLIPVQYITVPSTMPMPKIMIDESSKLPAHCQPKKNHNRSVPKQLRAQTAHKKEVAKSDFWKKI